MEEQASEVLGEEVIVGVRLEAPSVVKEAAGGGLVVLGGVVARRVVVVARRVVGVVVRIAVVVWGGAEATWLSPRGMRKRWPP